MSVITQYGNSALMIVAMKGNTEVVSLLLKAGANTDIQKMVCIILDPSTHLMAYLLWFFTAPHTGWRLCTDVGCQGG